MRMRMRNEFIYNFIGKISTALTTLLVMPFVGHFYGDFYLGLYGILATITVIFLVLEGGLSSNLISELSQFRNSKPSRKVSILLYEYFWFFCLVGLFAFLVVNLVGSSTYFISSEISQFKEKDQLFTVYGLFCFVSFLLLYIQSVSYGLGFYKFYNITITIFSLIRTFLPFFLLYFGYEINFISFLYIILLSNFACLSFFILFIFKIGYVTRVCKTSLKFHNVMAGMKHAYPVFLVSISSIFYTQFDKLLGLKILSLEMFGVYSTASSIASAPMILAGVIYSVMLPKFSSMVFNKDPAILGFFCKYMKLAAVCFIFVYALVIIILYTALKYFEPVYLKVDGDFTYFIFAFAILLLGSVIQAYSAIPYALQVAQKNVKSTLKVNYLLIPVFFVIAILLCQYISGYGLPLIWLLYNIVFIVFLYKTFIKNFLLDYKLNFTKAF